MYIVVIESCVIVDLMDVDFFVHCCLFLRLVTITGTRENIAKAFSAIGKKIEQVMKVDVHIRLSLSLSYEIVQNTFQLSPICSISQLRFIHDSLPHPPLLACFSLIYGEPKLIFIMRQQMAHMSLAPVSSVVGHGLSRFVSIRNT